MEKAATLFLFVVAFQLLSTASVCPYLHIGTPPEDTAEVPDLPTYDLALKELDIEDVLADLDALMTHSQACWPADFGHYGPLFVRMAWHCSGTFRTTDGLGGCGGGRQRFEPERSWEDNTNLDKARALVAPIKEKYGDGLSWGDLMIFAGSAAIRHMGGPVSQMCAGRMDSIDGTESLDLGPTPEQEKVSPCAVNGKCKRPLGTSTMQLIYVNPEGPVRQDANGSWKPYPDPAASAVDIRDVFGRMGMNDVETVALIGGGHAFGKTHGPCPEGPGAGPHENVSDPWPGKCGTGMAADTFTSGFEGPWSTTPTRWSNEFFVYLRKYKWEKHLNSAGHYQWRIENATGPEATLMRLTADMALVNDEKYAKVVEMFAESRHALDVIFDAAWFKLTTNGGRWSKEKKCISLSTLPLV